MVYLTCHVRTRDTSAYAFVIEQYEIETLLSAFKLFKFTFGRWPLTWLPTLFSSPVLYEFYAFPTLQKTNVNQKHQSK